MADFDYGFNQTELEAMLNNRATKFIMVSVSALKEGQSPVSEMYFFAQSYNDQQQLNDTIDPLTACPYPPNWKDDPNRPKPTHPQLETAPKYKFDGATLKTKLGNNNFPPAGDREAIVRMAADSTSGKLEVDMTFRILNADGKQTDSLTGVKF